jgi:6-hydroxynicotinate 3-monooxygenase
MTSKKPHIAIIGAGIGGLTAAACLRRIGIDAHIYEQARGFTRLGAGIQQAPNSIRVLYALGLKDKLLASAFQPDSNDSRDYDTGNLTNSQTLGQSVLDRQGVPYFLMHRGDLHAMLADLVPPVVVSLNHKLAGLDHAADGTVRRRILVRQRRPRHVASRLRHVPPAGQSDPRGLPGRAQMGTGGTRSAAEMG